MRIRFFLLATLACSAFSFAPLVAEDENQELKQARELYEKELEFTNRPIRSRYISKLETLKRSLGSRGDARGAIAVQEEIDRVKEGGGEGIAKFTGLWKIEYDNGTARRYAINPDGLVLWDDGGGAKAKITMKGSDFIVQVDPEKIERLTIHGDILTIEHYSPKTLYPGGPPSARAKGTRIPSSK